MWSILIPATDSLTTACWELGTAGLLEEPEGMRAFFPAELDPTYIRNQLHLPSVPVRHEPDSPSQDFQTLDWDPILIGRRFFVAPPWVTQPTPFGRIRLTLPASTAFGSGAHETTQLSIEAMESLVTPQSVVVDIGSGSGILSMAATALGARSVFSCDIHPTAQPHFFIGSADSIRSESADLTLANISAAVLDRLAWDLRRITKPTGLLVLSGFTHERQPQRFAPQQVLSRGDWLCWICAPRHIDAQPGSAPLRHSRDWWL